MQLEEEEGTIKIKMNKKIQKKKKIRKRQEKG